MSKANVAGIWVLDIRLLGSSYYLSEINQMLLSFWQKFPEAYLSLILLTEKIEYIHFFEKVSCLPYIEPCISVTQHVPLYDHLYELGYRLPLLTDVYETTKIHCFLLCQWHDFLSHHTIHDWKEQMNQLKQSGWQFHFLK